MESQRGVEQLYFELASQNRLNILRELLKKPLRMQEVARKLDLTDTETFRQLHRLNEAALIQRLPEGTYAITEYGRLVLQLSRSFEFVFENRQCLATRDLWRLPQEFIDRIGELKGAKLNVDMLEMLNISQQGVLEAEDHIWAMSEKPLDVLNAKVGERMSKGTRLRLIYPEGRRSTFSDVHEVPDLIEKRTLPKIPVNLVCTDKGAGVSLLSIDGRPDAALFFGRDEAFVRWANDLFLYYWDRGRR